MNPCLGLVLLASFAAPAAPPASGNACVECHQKVTPNLVADWEASRHRQVEVACQTCHGKAHSSAEDAKKALLPTPKTCGRCHSDQFEGFNAGKHSLAWASMKAMPTLHYQPMRMIEGLKGCGGCHKIGARSEEDLKAMREKGPAYGAAACNSCHTRHLFSKAEARRPEACQTCHMGFDHPQWEMYSSSKHGVRAALKAEGALPATAAAPTCQTCHMHEGNHGVDTPWGFLAVRLPMPEDQEWAADRTTILQALGVLDPKGNPTPRLEKVKAVRLAKLTQESWQELRDKKLAICSGCHARAFAKEQLEHGDALIRDADHLMAEAIRIVADLYATGALAKPASYSAAFPDLLTFHDAPTTIEQRLFLMFFEHRMRTFQGAFHNNPDYAFWYGWSEMQRDLTEIREKAAELKEKKGKRPAGKK